MTSLSCSAAILIAALGSVARAQDGAEVAQPEPAYPPPPVYAPEVAQPLPAYPPPRPPRPPRPPGPSGFERRHHGGGQLGGTGIAQIVYRFRATGPVYLEVGGLGIHGANFSAGVVVGTPVANRWFPYVGFGGGFMFGGTPKCHSTTTDCPNETVESFPFLHARVGIGVALGAARRSLVSFDVGGWFGRHHFREIDPVGGNTEWSKTIAMPMAGLSYFFAIH